MNSTHTDEELLALEEEADRLDRIAVSANTPMRPVELGDDEDPRLLLIAEVHARRQIRRVK